MASCDGLITQWVIWLIFKQT